MVVWAVLAGAPTTAYASTPVAMAAQETLDLSGNKQRTRFVIGVDRAVEPRVFALANPNRVIIDLPNVGVQLPALPAGQALGLVQSFRGGLAAADRFRVIIDVTEPVIVERSGIEPGKDGRGSRLVVEIVAVGAPKPAPDKVAPSATTTAAAVGPFQTTIQPPVPRPAERPEVRAAKAFKRTIVLDPGHGGHDSGAQKHGAVEKDVVLAFGRVLRDSLTATGRYRVLMTREDDTFVDLDDRREFAEKHNAALFMAIHADSAGSHARGATVYSLQDNVARSLTRSAQSEVVKGVLTDTDLKALKHGSNADVGTVQSFLAGLAEREVLVTRERTGVFARSLVQYMGASTNMMQNPDRTAAFTVLRTAKVPAVLVELAFVTNKEDAAKLKSDEWRKRVAASLLTAIDAYFADPASSPLR
jgi:N-acetylmuramoyl-L-alanine amidase